MTHWRAKKFGRVSGGEIARCVDMFREVWSLRAHWQDLNDDELKWSVALEKLISIPNWTIFYQDTLVVLTCPPFSGPG